MLTFLQGRWGKGEESKLTMQPSTTEKRIGSLTFKGNVGAKQKSNLRRKKVEE